MLLLLVSATPAAAAPVASPAGTTAPQTFTPTGSRDLGKIGVSGASKPRGVARSGGLSQPSTTGLLQYHGGPVMHTNSTYAIFWFPPGATASAGYRRLITGYLQNVAADSGKLSNVYASTTQYWDTQGPIVYQSSFGGAIADGNPFPASGCTLAGTSVCLTDAQIQQEVLNILPSGTPIGLASVFFVILPQNVGSCLDSTMCTQPGGFCAYHSQIFLATGGEILYANIPYAAGLLGCGSIASPNGDDADAAISLVSHEHSEAITDPNGDAWYDVLGRENGDICRYNYGTALGATVYGRFDQVIGTGVYETQTEWSNTSASCAQGTIVGGQDLSVQATTAGTTTLAWIGGTVQTGYDVLRLNGADLTILPTAGPLSATATAYTDTVPPTDQLDCYTVAPLNGATALGMSDLDCRLSWFQSAVGAPGNFSVGLNQSMIATLAWTAPGGQTAYVLGRLTPNVAGATWQTATLAGGATSATVSIGAQVTCFVLLAESGQTILGNTDILCGMPGLATFAPAGGAGTSLANATSAIRQAAAQLARQSHGRAWGRAGRLVLPSPARPLPPPLAGGG